MSNIPVDNYLKKELYALIKTDESIFDFIQESSLDGLWYWDLENPENEWMNNKFWVLLGYNPEEMPHKSSAWQTIINQDDLKTATDNFVKHLENPNYPYDQIVRYTHKNGSTVWIRCRGLAICDANGKPIRMLGAHHDITAIKHANEHLEQSERQFRQLFENMEQGFALHEMIYDTNNNPVDCRFVLINKAFEKLTGINATDSIGKTVKEVLPNIEPIWIENYGKVAQTGESLHFENYSQELKKYFDVIAYSPKKGTFAIVVTDNTEKRNQDIIIQQNNHRLKILLGLSQMAELDTNEIFNYALEQSTELCNSKIGFLGFLNEQETIVTIHAWSASAMKMCEIKDKYIDFEVAKTGIWGEVIRQRKPLMINDFKADNPLKRGVPQGHVEILNYMSLPIFDKGKIVALIAVGNKPQDYNETDIHELTLFVEGVWNIVKQRKYEKELIIAKEKAEESEARYRIIADNTTDSIWVMDADFRFTYLSPATEQLFGYSLQEWKTLDWSTFVHPDHIEMVHNAFGKLKLENKEKIDLLSVAVRHKNGTEMWIEFSANAIYDKDKVITSVVGITRNITERKRFELELAEITEEAITLKQSLDLVEGFAFTKDIELKYVSANHTFCDLSKIPYNKLKGMTDYDIFPPDLAEKYMADDRKVIETAEPITVEEETINLITNQRIILQTRKLPLFNKSGYVVGVYGMAYDITELKKAEYAMRRSEAIKNKIVSNINDVIVIIDQNEIIQYKSPNISKLFGWKPEELIGKNTWDIIHPDDLVEGQKFFGTILTKPNASGLTEMRYKHKDGHYVWIEINVINLFHDNDIQGILGNYHDISERKTAEQQLILAKAKAEESDRLKTAFLQNMSHEIRTPMNAIMGFSELLVRNYNDKPKLEKFSNIINQRCNDLLVIIEDILDIAKIESGQLSVTIENCNLNALFAELQLFFTEQQLKLQKQHIILNLKAYCNPNGSIILTDKVKLKQIFINLIGNAFKFTNSGMIEGGCQFDDNNNLIFYVSDTGIGIPSEKQQFIFDRFAQVEQTTNRQYGGTGLGLSIVKGLVELLGGRIWLESEVGRGSTFYFTIPHKSNSTLGNAPIIIEEKTFETFLHNKTILVVEDDAYNAAFIKEILSETGLDVLYAQYGNEAVQIASTHAIDLVLMDIRLPDISGYEATRQIKRQKPDLKIIAQTAYAASEDKQKALDAGCIDYISKPLKSKMLLSLLNKHLS
ncbi:MAG: PAS domain S-box protein [Bacteroidales bacterium]|nr:PAS domain S-box protein [Bacteroidales bacterium]MBN2818107.1 PAS domain S-box protein [Bacteroidales bacterium]